MARCAMNLSELVDRALVVQGLRLLEQSHDLTDSQLQDKLTIHFQKKSSYGGDVSDVIYPLNNIKDDAIVIFEEATDRDSAVRCEQVFFGKTLTVTRLPPVFKSIQAEIDPLYFKILPLRLTDEFPARLEKVANAVLDQSKFGKISCSKPGDLECVEREVMELVIGSKLTHDVSLLADDNHYDAAGPFNSDVETTHQAQRRSDPLRAETRKSQDHFDEEMAEISKRSSVKTDQFISAEASSKDGRSEGMHGESKAHGREGSPHESESYSGQETHMTLDKYTFKYLKTFQATDLQKLYRKYDIRLKTSPAKIKGQLEVFIGPRSAKSKPEDVVRANDEFITLYQKAHVDITRKTVDCTTVQEEKIKVVSHKIQQDFAADTLVEEVDGSPHLRLILRRGDVEEVARGFRAYAGIKSSKRLRTTGTSNQNDKKSQDEVCTSKGTQLGHNTQGTSRGSIKSIQWDSTQGTGSTQGTQLGHNTQGTPGGSTKSIQWDSTQGTGSTQGTQLGHNTQGTPGGSTKSIQWDSTQGTGSTQGTQRGYITQSVTQAPTEKSNPQQMHSNPLNPNNVSGESFVTNEGMHIVIIVGDITKQPVTAVVSPSDQYFNNSYYGVASAIHSAAGPEMGRICYKIKSGRSFQKFKVGECIVTSGFQLPCDAVIHAVGPSDGKDHSFGWNLFKTFISCLRKANEYKYQSLAMPLMGSGCIGAQKKICADNLAQALLAFSSESRELHFLQIVYVVDIDIHSAVACSQALHAAFSTNALLGRSREASAGVHASQSSSTDVRNPQGQAAQGPPTDQVSASTTVPHSTKEEGSTSKDKSAAGTLSTDVADTSPSASSTGLQADNGAGSNDEKTNECPICLTDNIVDVKVLDKCKHRFCKECIDKAMETRYTCPLCLTVCKLPNGNQPDGTMHHTRQSGNLPGYPGAGTITIYYDIPGGIQKNDHPHPGRRFGGATRFAYLPDNQEGREVLRLLRKAFDARLVFTVGRSVTSGEDDIVTWNDIHHKTSQTGGVLSYGYPDPEYLKRVKEDLAAKGILE